MQFPILNAKENPRGNTSAFFGLNRTESAGEGEFSDCLNLSTEHYPCLAPRKSRNEYTINGSIKNIQSVIAPKYTSDEDIDGFTGVADGAFWYRDVRVPFEEEDMQIPESDNICLADFNGYIIIAPVMYYFSYLPNSEGVIDPVVKKMEKGIADIEVTLYSSGDIDADGAVVNYLKADSSDAWEMFSSGDAVILSGFEGDMAVNNTAEIDSIYKVADEKTPISCVVEKIDGRKMYIQMYNNKGVALNLMNGESVANEAEAVISVRIPIPEMNWVCVHNNRLWGTNPNGELIYASKIGDPFNFNTFAGLTSDSWYSQVGTKGGFVGLASYRDNIVAFKRDYIHHVYGDKPINYAIPKQLSDCGCIDIRSAIEIGSVLYFMGYNGFYAYTGGQPEIISDKLARRYKSAVAMSDGIRYIVSAVDEEGVCELLTYDPRYNVWLKEDDLRVVSSLKWHNKLYAACKNEMVSLYQENNSDDVGFMMATGRITEDVIDEKGINEIFIVADIKDKSGRIDVYTDGEEQGMKLWGSITKRGYRASRVPVKLIRGDAYRIILKGKGNVIVHRIERCVSQGGRGYADR